MTDKELDEISIFDLCCTVIHIDEGGELTVVKEDGIIRDNNEMEKLRSLDTKREK